LFGAQFPLSNAALDSLVDNFDLTVKFVFLKTNPDLSLFSEKSMELIDLSLSWVFVVSWVFAKDDFFKTSDSLSAPFVDLSVPVIVGEDESLVVSVVLLVDFVDVELVVEVTSIDFFFGTGLEASVTTMVPVNIESFDTAKSEFGAWGTWQTDT